MALPRAAEVDPLGALARLDGVPQAVAATRLALDRLGGHRVLRRRGDTVRTESALRGAAAAASIELGRLV
ncbi:MAG: oxidoreductase, partial [Actinomycetota bacterium]|nr:oxidoreductase [Actinomycetota bacterium]